VPGAGDEATASAGTEWGVYDGRIADAGDGCQ
jgi:hypothetical protein